MAAQIVRCDPAGRDQMTFIKVCGYLRLKLVRVNVRQTLRHQRQQEVHDEYQTEYEQQRRIQRARRGIAQVVRQIKPQERVGGRVVGAGGIGAGVGDLGDGDRTAVGHVGERAGHDLVGTRQRRDALDLEPHIRVRHHKIGVDAVMDHADPVAECLRKGVGLKFGRAQPHVAHRQVNQVVEGTRSLVDDYRGINKEIDGLRVYNRLMTAQVQGQEATLEDIFVQFAGRGLEG